PDAWVPRLPWGFERCPACPPLPPAEWIEDLLVILPLQVPKEEALAFAQENHIPYMEASAKIRLNVDESFHEVVRAIRRFQELETPPAPTVHPTTKESNGCPCCIL
ncbi:ras-related protein R-Ras-like, partial [Terrapene carolina triunguis]|uniref:ras-related protein R-Ras-like n=1 Tax=Terrapene triunguis TaxID=2587831 RepID=UPI000CEFC2AF